MTEISLIPVNNNINVQASSVFNSYLPRKNTEFLSKTNYRVRSYNRDISKEDKTKALIGSTIGTIIPILFMMKKQNVKNPLKLKYGMWDMINTAAGSIIGGVGLGLIGEKKEVQKNRLKEGLFQFMNASIPTWIVGGVVSLCENSEKYNNKWNKILSVAGGLLVGMYGSAALSNLITDPKDKYPDRKLSAKDALANIDDGIGALALAKFPIIEKLNIGRFLPIIYTACGYRAGQSN